MTSDGAVVFVHAHPDDEAIFTGGTMARLAATGTSTVLVVATGGELGEVRPDFAADVSSPSELAAVRREECRRAAAELGCRDVRFLGYRDSGMAGDPANEDPASFWTAPVPEAAARLAQLLSEVGASAVVGYDDHGIYHHPDHIQVTRVVEAAAAIAGIETVYGATVDREHLHFVETHVVEEAVLAGDLGLARSRLGLSSVEIALTVDVSDFLVEKRRAMVAHASQIPESASPLAMPPDHFADVYGLEWYTRTGPEGPLETL
ncbi:MAG: PIG-L family deacetylase [Acidimicrobiales bacterium]|nr:PIG-L family deacetylase [Acidimicrobiales bacterium]